MGPHSALPAKGRILAIDPGERRIGVAAADLRLRVAIPLRTIEGGPGAAEAVARAGEGEGALAERLSVPGLTWDERLTSAEARRRLSAEGRRPNKADVDALAAAIILQAYLDSQRQPASG